MAKRFDLDDLRAMFEGEEPKSSWLWPALGGLAVGAAVGVALGMALAPKKGSELIEDVKEKLGGTKAGEYLASGQRAPAPTSANAPPVRR